MNAYLDPVEARLAADLSFALSAPNQSAQSQLAAMKVDARRRLDEAELTIADLAGRFIAAQEHAKAEKQRKLDEHTADEDAVLARDAGAVERLKDQLAEAERVFAENAQAFKLGRASIVRDCDADLSMTLLALSAEEDAAKMMKAMAEGMLAAAAQEVRG